MKALIKVGAGIALVLFLASLIVVASRDAALVLPTWLIISYAAAWRLLPAGRRPIAAPVAVICGQLAWRLLQALVVGLALQPALASMVVAVALAWLLLTGSRWAVWAIIMAELAALALVLPGLSALIEALPDQGFFTLLPALLALYVAPAAAVGLLVPKLRHEPESNPAVGVFD